MRRGPSDQLDPQQALHAAMIECDARHAIEATPGAKPWHRTNSNRFKGN